MNDRLTLMGMLAAGRLGAGTGWGVDDAAHYAANLAKAADALIAEDAKRAPVATATPLPAWVKPGAICMGRSSRRRVVLHVAYDLALAHDYGRPDEPYTMTAEDFREFGAWPCDVNGNPLAPETPTETALPRCLSVCPPQHFRTGERCEGAANHDGRHYVEEGGGGPRSVWEASS